MAAIKYFCKNLVKNLFMIPPKNFAFNIDRKKQKMEEAAIKSRKNKKNPQEKMKAKFVLNGCQLIPGVLQKK